MKKLMIGGIIAAVTISSLTGCLNNANTSKGNQMQNLGQPPGPAQKQPEKMVHTPWVASKNTTRINTDNVAEAAVLVSKTLWMATGEDNRPGGVILVNLDDWQTALASADLIHHPNNGPVLFVNQNDIPEVTLNELKRLKPTGAKMNNGIQVVLVGNFDQRVEDQVKGIGLKTDKITGGNPAAVAKAIDAYYADITGGFPTSVIVGSMDSREYTMPAVNWISHMPEPILYVTKEGIPQETIDALKKRGGKANIYILGPESVVSSNVQKQLAKFGKVARIEGSDPYKNAVAFAKYKDPSTDFGWGITTPGHNFSFVSLDSPDLALAAAPFSHLGKHAPLLWTKKDSMPDSVMSYVMSVQPKYNKSPTEGPYNHAWLTGNKDNLSAAAQGEIDSMLEIVSKTGEGHGGHGGTMDTEEMPHQSKGANDHDMANMPEMEH